MSDAKYTKPELRKRIVARIKAGSKGGAAGQWSARKAQLVAAAYKKAGGGYKGGKGKKQKSLSKWTKEEWGTKSGKPSTQGAKATGERYLPKKALLVATPSPSTVMFVVLIVVALTVPARNVLTLTS